MESSLSFCTLTLHFCRSCQTKFCQIISSLWSGVEQMIKHFHWDRYWLSAFRYWPLNYELTTPAISFFISLTPCQYIGHYNTSACNIKKRIASSVNYHKIGLRFLQWLISTQRPQLHEPCISVHIVRWSIYLSLFVERLLFHTIKNSLVCGFFYFSFPKTCWIFQSFNIDIGTNKSILPDSNQGCFVCS